MTDEDFLRLVDAGVDELPAEIQQRITNVAIVIRDQPSRAQREAIAAGTDDTIFGLYEGVPLTERGYEDEPRLPDTITIFKEPILAAYDRPEDIAACVSNTVWHELAHYFGRDEAWVQAEEVRRGKTL